MSGVSDFLTSIDSMLSLEITSSATERTSLSGAGRRTPLTDVALSSGSSPRTDTKRPSPWSLRMLTRGRRRDRQSGVLGRGVSVRVDNGGSHNHQKKEHVRKHQVYT